ncbi:right-handed parallel beta-helix repeat-containing protein [Fulvivirga lutea]|uniref:Right-handed parallel beta-helix repeat-containing protein n=1 Tax=Fulvivirga lutea TaxID=2810512 RepID=A0A974WHK7_9BACT|nr:right-handed parallel beta-helix repeat-containing protein [Fulvivirga lutea]QSE98029.1 right-handed parallel beta-helix repeat-containing protein [Fulvivirga lutea]
MRYILLLFVVLAFACQPEEEKFTSDASAKLRFSADTVLFDTVFTSLGSVTKRFRAYNDSKNAVNISSVSLANGPNSQFSIFVNGLAGPSLENIRILGGDSILILAEVTINPQDEDLPFIVTDQIQFNTNGNAQDVDLVAWGQDANFLRDSVLMCNTTWTAERPYVIYNSVLVNEGCQLTIEPGTKVYSHNGSFIFIAGTLSAIGTADERITFINDRFDESFKNAPGQWGGLIFLQGSDNNQINYADIRNANVGIYLGTPDDDTDPDLILSNTRIENMGGNSVVPSIDSLVQPGYGILAISSDLQATNVLVNNCQINTLANIAGGNYDYRHCTFGNFSFDFFRRDPSVVFSNNLVLGDNSLLVSDLSVTMSNSIVWGSLREELLTSNAEEAGYSLTLSNNILRTQTEALASANIVEDPKFLDPAEYDYSLDTLSPAKDTGLDFGITTDLEGKMRDSQPDIGAFERIE